MGQTIRKGAYFVCNYRVLNGDNGDVIVGKITSVRTNGLMTLERLPSGITGHKQLSDFRTRNTVVSKKQALEVVAVYNKLGKRAAREAAVKLAAGVRGKSPGQLELKPARPPKPRSVTKAVALLKALPDAEFQAVAHEVWGDVLAVFGVNGH